VALAPCILALLLWGVWLLPLRVAMLVLLVLSWTLEVTGDAFAMGKVQTPWHALGAALFEAQPDPPSGRAGLQLLRRPAAPVGGVDRVPALDRLAPRPGWLGVSPRPIGQAAILLLVGVGLDDVLRAGARRQLSAGRSGSSTGTSTCRWCFLLMSEAMRGAPTR